MKIPYNKVHVRGQILFAARGGAIHTFNLTDGSHISSWKHPDVDKVADSIKAINEAKAEDALAAETNTPATESEGPPTKRQKLGGEDESAPVTAEAEAEASTSTPTTAQDDKPRSGHFEGRGKKGKGKARKEVESGKTRFARVPDRPVITHLTSTPNGSHLLAVTGHDKAVWVLKHDGNGQIEELSRRTMPKRPSAIAIGPFGQIICADKFGDVYALPVVIPDEGAQVSASMSALPMPAKKAFKPTANSLTVHSKGNRLALLNQIKQAELFNASKDAANANIPEFELHLLLGHVSMLTALVIGEKEGRTYILTADRDEHIRVSRYIPHAHIIENFCFGHKEFINDMVIPPKNQDILVSGGGDEYIFVWDWLAGKQLFKTSVLSLAQEIAPETTAVAVSSIHTLIYPSEEGPLTYILAICEDIKAIFSWKLLENNELHCPGIIQLPGKPLSLTISPGSDDNAAPTIIAAIDPDVETKAQSLHAFRLTINHGRLAVDVETGFKDKAVEADESEISEEEVRSLLYTVESLRKVVTNAEFEEAGSEAPQATTESDLAADTADTEE